MKKTGYVGTVVRVDGRRALVELESSTDCAPAFGCSCCASIEPRRSTVRVQRRELEQGDRVLVLMPTCLSWLGPLIGFLLPLLLLAVGGLGGWLATGRTTAREGPILAGALAGFALGIVAAMVASKWLEGPRLLEVRRLGSTEAG